MDRRTPIMTQHPMTVQHFSFSMPLFSPGLLKRTELLSLSAARTGGSPLLAAARKKLPGGGTEVTGHRDYSPGDDFHAIDWTLFARRNELRVKLFEGQRDRDVHLLLDCSPSMGWAARRSSSWPADRRGPGLREPDESRSAGGSGLCRRAGRRSAAAAAASRVLRLLRFLEGLSPRGAKTDLVRAVETFVRRPQRQGPVVVISDCTTPADFTRGFDLLRFHGYDPRLVHMVDPGDAEPRCWATRNLIDVESRAGTSATITERTVRRYRALVAEFHESVREYCRRRGIVYMPIPATCPRTRSSSACSAAAARQAGSSPSMQLRKGGGLKPTLRCHELRPSAGSAVAALAHSRRGCCTGCGSACRTDCSAWHVLAKALAEEKFRWRWRRGGRRYRRPCRALIVVLVAVAAAGPQIPPAEADRADHRQFGDDAGDRRAADAAGRGQRGCPATDRQLAVVRRDGRGGGRPGAERSPAADERPGIAGHGDRFRRSEGDAAPAEIEWAVKVAHEILTREDRLKQGLPPRIVLITDACSKEAAKRAEAERRGSAAGRHGGGQPGDYAFHRAAEQGRTGQVRGLGRSAKPGRPDGPGQRAFVSSMAGSGAGEGGAHSQKLQSNFPFAKDGRWQHVFTLDLPAAARLTAQIEPGDAYIFDDTADARTCRQPQASTA